MNTIREAFSFNLRIHRGNRTQAQMAEFLGLPLRTYQKIETGTLPTEATMKAITQKLGVSEASLVQLPDVEAPKPKVQPTNADLLAHLQKIEQNLQQKPAAQAEVIEVSNPLIREAATLLSQLNRDNQTKALALLKSFARGVDLSANLGNKRGKIG